LLENLLSTLQTHQEGRQSITNLGELIEEFQKTKKIFQSKVSEEAF
jgi:hypothetical protein